MTAFDEMNDIVNFISEGSNVLSEYEYRLFNGGLTGDDINDIKKELQRLYIIDFKIKWDIQDNIRIRNNGCFEDLIKYQKYLLREIGDIMTRLYKILTELENSCLPFNMETFIRNNSSLLHLVSTNNHSNQHIRKVSDDSFFYKCHFHVERCSSMRVNNNKNRLCCYACGKSLNIVEYLMELEGLSWNEALLLLAEINKIEVPNNPYSCDNPLVVKYTNRLALDRFEKRVLSGELRAKYKNKTYNNFLALEKFEQERETITRIRNNVYIKPEEKRVEKRLLYVVN